MRLFKDSEERVAAVQAWDASGTGLSGCHRCSPWRAPGPAASRPGSPPASVSSFVHAEAAAFRKAGTSSQQAPRGLGPSDRRWAGARAEGRGHAREAPRELQFPGCRARRHLGQWAVAAAAAAAAAGVGCPGDPRVPPLALPRGVRSKTAGRLPSAAPRLRPRWGLGGTCLARDPFLLAPKGSVAPGPELGESGGLGGGFARRGVSIPIRPPCPD